MLLDVHFRLLSKKVITNLVENIVFQLDLFNGKKLSLNEHYLSDVIEFDIIGERASLEIKENGEVLKEFELINRSSRELCIKIEVTLSYCVSAGLFVDLKPNTNLVEIIPKREEITNEIIRRERENLSRIFARLNSE